MEQRFDPSACNVYLFYASDGDNASDDRAAAAAELERIAQGRALRRVRGDLGGRAQHAERDELAVPSRGRRRTAVQPFSIAGPDDVAPAVRHFFTAESQADASEAGGGAP